MKKVLLLISLFYIAGCSKHPEPIFLSCEGKETTKGSDGNRLFDPETVNIARTFKFYNDKRLVEQGSDYIYNSSQNSIKSETKNVYIVSIDNAPEFFEGDVYTYYVDGYKRLLGYVSLTDTEIFAQQRSESKTKDYEKYDDYQVSINRISGEFRENHQQQYKGKLHGMFDITSIGTCKKVDKKI